MKTLGKDFSGSEYLASSTNLLRLLGYATAFKDDSDASSEALRCIANALLLIEEARNTFISKTVNGGDTCLTMLEVFNISIQVTFYLGMHANRNLVLQTRFSFYVGRSFFQQLPGHHTLKV